TLPLVLVGGVVLAVALGLVTQDWGDGASSPEGAQAAGAVVEVSPVALDMEQALAEHIASAQAIVARGLTQDPSDPWVRRDVGTELLGEGAYPAAARIFQGLSEERPEDHEVRVLTARALAGMGEYKGARELLLAGLVVAPEHEETTRAFQDMIKEDPNLHPPVMTLGVDMQIDTMRKLGGGRSVSMRLVRDGETRYAFKPSQLQWEEGWRAEIAAYLLCEVLPCRFKVPKNIPLRISKQDFERLYLKNTPKQRLYAERFEELLWVVEPGPDGVEREYLYGTAKEWVPKFVDWPIEYTDIWSPWLKANAQRWVLRQKLNQAIWNLRKVQDGRYYRLILSQRAESTTREIAHQLSDILVFDYLTNNFDRFSQREEFYGVNNQFRAGTFVSLDNGAAFYGTEQLRTKQRFELTERFSRHMVAALRAIDPESMGPVFFPDPSEKAKRRLEIFWKRRDAAIARVDRLVERHGAPKVLYFP
ncbi:MAG: tetratricopeptide repeat protein, partial [Myxococcota bacterium]